MNVELGRAWLKLELSDMTPFDELEYEDHRVKVIGMSFDQNSGNTLLGGIICASTRSSRRYLKIYPT